VIQIIKKIKSTKNQKIKCKCIHCTSKNIIQKGLKKNKFRTIQKYQCKDCKKYFTLSKTQHTTYPISTIIKAVSLYNLGYSLKQVSETTSKTQKSKIPQSTISAWLEKYKQLTTYNKLRKQATKLYNPKDILFKKPLQHRQVYNFKYHKAKQILLPKLNKAIPSQTIEKLNHYLDKITTDKFPHHIFNSSQRSETEQRSSQLTFNTLNFLKTEKNNYANKLAELALKTAKNNYQRHEVIQNFMLINDTSTVAIEVPVYLTNDDITYFLSKKFKLPLENQQTPITGHIDILQLRNNMFHILDYKPEAKSLLEKASGKGNPVNQLTLYALALASRLQIPLKQFKAAWFDEKNYYEFYPLHVVYEKKCNLR